MTPALSQPAPLPATRPSSLQTAASVGARGEPALGPPLLPQRSGQSEPALRRLLEPPARTARSTSARADTRTSPLSKTQARPLWSARVTANGKPAREAERIETVTRRQLAVLGGRWRTRSGAVEAPELGQATWWGAGLSRLGGGREFGSASAAGLGILG